MKKILLTAIFITTALTSFAQVGIGTNTPNVSAALDVESSTLGFLPPRMTQAEMIAIASPAEGLTVYCNDCTPKSLYFFDGTAYIAAVNGTVVSIPVPAAIGDFRDGGVVFWLNGSGGGLVCTVSDQSTSAPWGCYGAGTAAVATAIGTGAANTAAIEVACTTAGTAADLADNLALNGYSDWFLPSKDELNAMYLNKAAINATATVNGGANFANNYYWSSTQTNNTDAWRQDFNNGFQNFFNKSYTFDVRAVRAF